MKFLFLTQYYPPEIGAAQVRLAAVVRELLMLGHKVEVVTALPNYPTTKIFREYEGRFYVREEMDNLIIHRVWMYPARSVGFKRMLNYMSFTATCLFGLVRSKRPDYVFVELPPLFLSIPAFIAARCWRAQLILNISDLWLDAVRDLGLMKNWLMLGSAQWLEQWAFRVADHVNAVTQGIRSTLITKKGVPDAKVLFLPNGVDTELFKPAAPDHALAKCLSLTGKKIVIYAGTHGITQALEHVVYAALLLKDQRELHFIFVGEGPEKEKISLLAEKLGLGNVSFLSQVPLEQLPRFLSISMVGLVPQRAIALFDANRPAKLFPIMASGIPVLFSGAGESARLIQEAKAGIVARPEDPQALAEAITSLTDNLDLVKTFGQNAREYVQKNLRWSILVKNWLEELCGPAPVARR